MEYRLSKEIVTDDTLLAEANEGEKKNTRKCQRSKEKTGEINMW